MIITGIFLFLLGTKLGEASSKTEVKYEGMNKVSVKEEREENVLIPGLGSPPFAPSFIHQGSNFFFNPQIVMPGGIIPPVVEEVIPFKSQNISITETLSEKVEKMEIIIPEPPVIVIPEVEITETVQLPPVKVDIEMPLPEPVMFIEEPRVPCVEYIPNIPAVPVLIEEPQHLYPGAMIVSEVDVRINEIPPPPELPPLIVTEIPRPEFIQERKVILIPSAPELTTFYPPSILANTPIMPTDCVQNIVFERFLPNVAYENGKMVEFISIPATKRAPVVSSIIY